MESYAWVNLNAVIYFWVSEHLHLHFTPRSVSQGGNGGGHAHARFHLQPGRGGVVCLLSALTAARGYWETDRLWVLLDGRGAHGSTRCSLSTVGLTAEWFLLSSLQTPQKSLDLSLLTKKKSPGGWFVCVIISAWSGGKRWRYSLCIGKSLNFYSEKQNLEILLLQQFIVIYLLTT